MTSPESNVIERPLPHAARANITAILFSVFAGPAAWLMQLWAGYALASAACFRDGERLNAPVESLRWTTPAMIWIMIGAVAMAVISLALSRRALGAIFVAGPTTGMHDVEQPDVERARFLAQWGVTVRAGFAFATFVTALAFMVLPRCAG